MHDDDDDDDYEYDDEPDDAFLVHRGALYVEDPTPNTAWYSPLVLPGGGFSGRSLRRVMRTLRACTRKPGRPASCRSTSRNVRLQRVVSSLCKRARG
jgi:hypothetical protein